jgi:hypothetical protein
MKQSVSIGDLNFSSKKEAEQFVKNKMNSIGGVGNLKENYYNEYLFFYTLFQKHNYADEKLINCVDIRLFNNFNGLAFEIVNNDNTSTDISWRKCITNRKDTDNALFRKALRTTIKPQIDEFRLKNDASNCELCDTKLDKLNTHIDHIIHFHKLVSQFCDEYEFGDIPTNYDKIKNTYLVSFIEEDTIIGETFYDFHLENAKLRKVCDKCNLKRPN